MVRADGSTHPVQALREAVTSLEAAMLMCLARPRKEAIHRLRTSTRRIEAQLELLSMLPDLPQQGEQKQYAARLLKKLRQAAGEVRDIDVQRNLIRDEAAGKSGAHGPNPQIRDQIGGEARSLNRELKRKRDEQANHLVRLLVRLRVELPLVFEKLLDTLKPAEATTLTEAELIALVRKWYARRPQSQPTAPAAQDVVELHNIRKRAKLARYLAESAPQAAVAARRLAAQFEELQQAGGQWHDWLLLSKVAAQELGDSAKLTQRFAMRAARSLRAFRRRLSYKI